MPVVLTTDTVIVVWSTDDFGLQGHLLGEKVLIGSFNIYIALIFILNFVIQV